MQKKQFGRSMIEMLGVLAIIGVMSIGGIAGYRIAMNKYQANVILEDVNRFAFTIVERSPLPDGEISPADFVQTTPYTVTATNDVEGDYFYIDVHGVPKGVCKEVLNKKSNDFEIYAGTQGNYLYQGDDDICDNTNLVTFYFGDTDGLCEHTPGQNEEACVHGCVCDGACLTDEKTGDNVCCDNNTQKACNGACYDECNEESYFDKNSCSCKCFDEMKQIDANGNCVCRTDASGTQLEDDGNGSCVCPSSKPYYFDEASGGPACCAAGYTPVNGVCHRLYCEGTTCYLDGVICGQSCSTVTDEEETKLGINCGEHGNCYVAECSAKSLPSEFKKSSVGNGYLRYWCVVGEDDEKVCAMIGNETSPRCYSKGISDNVGCGYADADLRMQNGLCDANYCVNHFSSLDSDVNYNRVNGRRYGCFFPNHNHLYCQPKSYKDVVSNGKTERVPDKWDCYYESKQAGNFAGPLCSNCDTPETCLNDCVISCKTGEYVTSHGGKQYCCDKAENPTLCRQDVNYFYTSNWLNCGTTCSYTTGLCTRIGSCTPQMDCKTPEFSGCGEGYDCMYASTGGYHCYNSTKKIWCVHSGGYHCGTAPNVYNCGDDCDLGGHCNKAYMPECVKSDPTTGKAYCPVIAAGYDMGTDSENPTCLCKYGDGTAASVTLYNGHYYCCPTGHTYINGACSAG